MPSSYRAVNTFQLGYKNQSVYAVSGTSRCLLSDKYKTHKYSVGRAYSCWMLNCSCITRPVGFKGLKNTSSLWPSEPTTKILYLFLKLKMLLCKSKVLTWMSVKNVQKYHVSSFLQFFSLQLSKSEVLTTASRRRGDRINANLILYLSRISDCLYLSCYSLKETACTCCFSIQWRELAVKWGAGWLWIVLLQHVAD